jgi:DnaJ-class molecular chaperone
MVKDTKLYDVLELNPNATDDDIKIAYKKLSKIWHPDKNPDKLEEATKKFQEISDAKTILTNPEKRKMYDMHGIVNENDTPDFNHADLFGAFSGMFGGGMPPFFNNRNNQNQNQEHCVVEHLVTLEDLYCMRKITVKYNQKVYCTRCNGTGSKDGRSNECSGCNGQGKTMRMIRQGNMVQQFLSQCEECSGTGEKVKSHNLCDDCHGNKYLIKEKSYEQQLKRNMVNNNKIGVPNMGHQFKNMKTNLIIIIKEQPHPIFKRMGDDLHIDIKLRLFQSLYGFTKMITHLDGRNILLKYDKMLTNINTIMKIKNEGMNGHLYIHITTTMPKLDRLDEQENVILKKLLIKAHLSEYQKEQNIIKNIDKLSKVTMEEVEESSNHNNHHNDHHNDNHDTQESPGIQCAQQ